MTAALSTPLLIMHPISMTDVTLWLMAEPRIIDPADQRLATILRRRIRESGHTQTSFANAVGRTQSWVSSHLLAKPGDALRYLAFREPATFERLLSALKWTPEELAAATALALPGIAANGHDYPERSPSSQYTEVPLTRPVPVYPAGTGPAWDLEDALEPLHLPADLYAGRRLIGLKAMGDSMAPYLPAGATAVIVHDDGLVSPGDYCGVRMADDGVVVKRFVRELEDGALLLESLNPDPGEERLFTAPLGSRVIGKVVRRIFED